MKEFMLLIHNQTDSKSGFSAEEHLEFLNACKVYVEKLKRNGNLISAQPLIREGKMISGSKGVFTEVHYTDTTEVIVGYYHVLAKDFNDAVAIAKANPEFAYTSTARIEVRPIKMTEERNAYTYPAGK